MVKAKGNPSWRKGGPSPNPTGKGKPRADGYYNLSTSLGVRGRDKAVTNTGYTADIVNAEEALELWRGDPIAARIIETLPAEALRQGFELCVGDDEIPDTYDPGEASTEPPKRDRRDSAFARRTRHAITRGRYDTDAKPLQEAITKQFETLGLVAALREALCYERAGGGGAILLGANDFTTDLRIPLDVTKIRSLDYLTPLEAREVIPLYYYADPTQPKFGQVAIYQLVPYVIGAAYEGYGPRVTQIHESRLIVFPGARVTRRIMAGNNGWGDSVFTRVATALRAFNVGHQGAETLLSDFAQAVYQIKGLADLVARNPNALTDSMLNVELGRSICNAVVIDSEEHFERKSTTLAGYPETLDRLSLYLASACDMPLSKVLGQQPGGLNATGDADTRNWYDSVANYRSQRIAPAIMRVTELVLASMGEDPASTNHTIKWAPLWQASEKETADARYVQAQADAVYITNDVASPEEIAMSRFGGDQYSFETRIDFEARTAQQSAVAPTVGAKLEATPTQEDLYGPKLDGERTRAALLKEIAPNGKCDICGAKGSLEIDHVKGRDWTLSDVSKEQRVAKYWKEYDNGIALRGLCRSCNASDGAKNKQEH